MSKLLIAVTGDPIPEAAASSGNFAAMIQAAAGLGHRTPITIVDARRAAMPDLATVWGVIVSGSPHSVLEPLPWIGELAAYLRRAVARERWILGLCFGHQLLASALGGAVARNPRGREYGLSMVHPLTRDDWLGLSRRTFRALMAHEDTVVRLPPGSVPLACTERDAHAAIRFSARCWGLQFHPEFSAQVGRAYVEHERASLRAQGDDPEALLRQVTATPTAQKLLRRFCQQARKSQGREPSKV